MAAVLSLVYGHSSHELSQILIDIQHDYHSLILNSNHVHLDKHNCLEINIMKGPAGKIKRALANF